MSGGALSGIGQEPWNRKMDTLAETAHAQAIRYVANAEFNQAALFFEDGSYLQFEHTSRTNRRAKASSGQSMADTLCRSLRLFRLNAKHLQLYFEDGSDAEFFVPPVPRKNRESDLL